MALVIAGEIDRMGILYEKYKRPLYSYFYKLTNGNGQAAEDLVHTVFYRVIRYKSTFSREGTFAKWLFRIAHNTGIDYHRKIKNVNAYNAEIKATQPVVYENLEMEKSEQIAVLEKALRQLKPDEREILILGKIDSFSYREIADILNITESNVKIRIFRALRKLKDLYMKIDR
jgi:RNA polymerase sigma-70 factor (ECF subfamily)